MKKNSGFSNVEGIGQYNFADGNPLEAAKTVLTDASARVDAINKQIAALTEALNSLPMVPIGTISYNGINATRNNISMQISQLQSQLASAIDAAKKAQDAYNYVLQTSTLLASGGATGSTPGFNQSGSPATGGALPAPNAGGKSFFTSTAGIATISIVSLAIIGFSIKFLMK